MGGDTARWIKVHAHSARAIAGSLALSLTASSLTSCAATTPPDSMPTAATPVGPVWLAEDIGGGGIIDSSHLTLTLDGNGRASGRSGCNQYGGRYRLTGKRLAITQVAGTEKACAPALMMQENRFLDILGRVATWQIEPTGALMLFTRDGVSLRFFPEG